jgi:hypothetical protein
MKSKLIVLFFLITIITIVSCNKKERISDMNIIFLHHSTGEYIWYGKDISFLTKAAKKVSNGFRDFIGQKAILPELFEKYNKEKGKNYTIKETEFPKASPYGWNNNPYDYYNIWVKNAGEKPYMEEPTLEMLTKEYQVIIFKHCFPVCNIKPDQDSADINSYLQTISNYKLQYSALRDKLHSFPGTKFILFTGAAQVKSNLKEDEALRAKEFFSWVKDEWDLPGDNIFIFDIYGMETEGGLYLKNEYAVSPNDSHPNGKFTGRAVRLLFNRITDVIETDGSKTLLSGEAK